MPFLEKPSILNDNKTCEPKGLFLLVLVFDKYKFNETSLFVMTLANRLFCRGLFDGLLTRMQRSGSLACADA